ncbi:hypothetical protein [Streptomyces sp. NBC_01216]|uniref:hypothetical protein n=1 Tax=unclassified Streptomyces TaxID=2593676 RepID=UPI002E10309A|nr:hypothetical protein OG393_31865 [Streptomyces sp. NBC_01216]
MNLQDRAHATPGDAPIYAGLVKELGDIPAEVSRTAEKILREVDHAVDFSRTRAAI